MHCLHQQLPALLLSHPLHLLRKRHQSLQHLLPRHLPLRLHWHQRGVPVVHQQLQDLFGWHQHLHNLQPQHLLHQLFAVLCHYLQLLQFVHRLCASGLRGMQLYLRELYQYFLHLHQLHQSSRALQFAMHRQLPHWHVRHSGCLCAVSHQLLFLCFALQLLWLRWCALPLQRTVHFYLSIDQWIRAEWTVHCLHRSWLLFMHECRHLPQLQVQLSLLELALHQQNRWMSDWLQLQRHSLRGYPYEYTFL